MKFLYTAVLLFLFTPFFAQESQFGPIQGNPVLRSFSAKEEVKKAQQIKQMAGFNPLKENEVRFNGACPGALPPGLNVVEAGSSVTVELDTFGLMGPGADTVFTVLTTPAFGTASLPNNSISLTYGADGAITNLTEETVLVELKIGDQRDTISTVFTIKRKGETVVLPTEQVDPEEIRIVCLDGQLDFDSPLACADLLPCIDDYAGEGNQFFYLSSFPGVDTCLVYEASRFPGVDTVCVMVCDELAVCDEFKIPFEISGQTITITANNPFFDDFSSYDGPYPSPQYWLDRSTFVNTTLAANPPSVGFATFDGLNRRGNPYDIANFGVGDVMTSQRMDISAFGPNDPLSLRYFVAPKGYSLDPEPGDNFMLEFLNSSGEWILISEEEGIDVPLSTVPPFEFRGIEIDDPQFLHDAFQFRFSSIVSPGGYGDMWHLDYVFLGNVDANNENFDDIAFSVLPNNFLKNNSSMPFRHFLADVEGETIDSIASQYFSTYEATNSLSESDVRFRELTTGTLLNNSSFALTATGAENNILPKVPESRSRNNPQISDIRSSLSTIPDDELRIVQIEYSFEPNEINQLATDNDTVRLNVPFANYFAHDDGTAEWAYFIFQAQGGEEVAQGYRTNVSDEVHAIQIMFPHFTTGDPADQSFTLKVWIDENEDGDLNSEEEVFARELLRPFFPDAVYDTLQGFTTYILDDLLGNPLPVSIDANKDFYVGVQYGSNTQLSFPLGFDLQNDCDCVLTNLNDGSFTKLNQAGSLMIRPVMEDVPFNTSSGTTDVAPSKLPMTIYPNPTSGILNIKVEEGRYEDYKILVFNQLGQLIAEPQSGPTIDIGGMESGIYFLQISDLRGGSHFVKRIILE